MTIKRWAGVDAVLRCFCKKIDRPIIRLANDHQIVEAMLGVSCLLDATVSVSCSVEDLRLGHKTPLGDIRTVESDLNSGHHLGRLLAEHRSGEDANNW